MQKFGVKPDSTSARMMQNTLKSCEEPTMLGEEKFCATSVESMIDFTISKLGKNIQAFTTNMPTSVKRKEEYFIADGLTFVGDAGLVCHRMPYVYVVFYCHKIQNTVAYTVPLFADDKTKGKAIAICHRDTSNWSPNHVAFKILNVKPGSTPICHFLYPDNIAWVRNQMT